MRFLQLVTASLGLGILCTTARSQTPDLSSGPDPKEIPLPEIVTPLGKMPGVKDLPVRKELPDVMTMNDGTKVTTQEQWQARREEMKKIPEYYHTGVAPPPPGNVKGKEVSSQLLADGKIKYRLIHLTFGPQEKLSLDIGIFTPTSGGPFVTYIEPSGTPPGATPLPKPSDVVDATSFGTDKDYQLVRAIDLLRGVTLFKSMAAAQ